MIELKTKPFVILKDHKKYILGMMAIIYGSLIYKGYPFEVVSLGFALPFAYIICAENPSNYNHIKFTDQHIEIDGQIYSYQDLKHYKFDLYIGRDLEGGYFKVFLKFIKDSELYDFRGTIDEIVVAKKQEAKSRLEALMIDKGISSDHIDSFRETYSPGRQLLMSFLWALYLVLGGGVVYSLVTSHNYRNGGEYNAYFWVPLLAALFAGWTHFYLLRKGYRSSYKMAKITKSAKRTFDKKVACWAGLIIFLVTLQALYLTNRNMGKQEHLFLNTTILKKERSQLRKGCNLKVFLEAKEINEVFIFDLDCKNDESLVIDSAYPLEIFKGSLGGYYFERDPF